eukprot:sb/3479143/
MIRCYDPKNFIPGGSPTKGIENDDDLAEYGITQSCYFWLRLKIQAKRAWPFWALSSPRLKWKIFLVFLGPHRSTMQVENLCYVSVHHFSKSALAY